MEAVYLLSKEQNDRLTQTGPGTPCGELLRRYWQPLCPTGEIAADQKKALRILGEDLLVFRTPSGEYGCVEESCPHRHASLLYGFVEDGGVRCCYHGWKFGLDGACLERPFEQNENADHIRLRAYPVQELGGLLFVYMGPDPARAPLLPRWDVLVRTDGLRRIRVDANYECNWLQIQENTADTTHTYYVHARMSKELDLPTKNLTVYYDRPIESYGWDVCEWGIEKWIQYGGDKPGYERRPPQIFPNILRQNAGPENFVAWRVPIDDSETRILIAGFIPKSDGTRAAEGAETPFVYSAPFITPDGKPDLTTFNGQDRIVWITQGKITDRTTEILGASDRGIVMYRRMLDEQIARVERGEDPNVAVVRDPEKNQLIEFGEVQTGRWWEKPDPDRVDPYLVKNAY